MNTLRSLYFTKVFFVILVVSGWIRIVPSLDAQTAGSGAPIGISRSGLWRDVDDKPLLAARGNISAAAARGGTLPSDYRTLHLDRALLSTLLAGAPQEFSAYPRAAASAALELELPIPQSTQFARFQVEESSIMAPGLAARYPDIHTYTAHGIDNPALVARLDVTSHGFHALILSPDGQVYVDPYFADGTDPETAIAYFKRDYAQTQGFQCLVRSMARSVSKAVQDRAEPSLAKPTGASLRVYRLALAATAEYAAAVGGGSVTGSGTFLTAGTVAGALGAMVTTINRVDAVYEREFAIRMVLVDNTDKLIYLNPSTDPYTNSDGDTMLDQNQRNVDRVIGDANYDIGHVFSTGGGGIAELGVVCTSGYKAQGVTGSTSPTGDPYDIDYVAHEMGHQFGADHCFNSTVGGCNGNRNADTAYEPGSGVTIMTYPGLCSSGNSVQDLAPHCDDYFHTVSYDEIDDYTTTGDGRNAYQTLATGNHPPTVATPAAYTIPISTPFTLTASATDADGDRLTYCWEEFDLGAAVNATTISGLDNGAAPIFRSYPPTASPTRFFPSLTYILHNANVPPLLGDDDYLIGEALPSKARPAGLNFRCTVRDNHPGGGGSTYVAVKLTVAAGAGPFIITAPNAATTLAGGSTQTVTWNVANTSASPVSCANVKISLSTDGGLTFPYALASSTPNTGSAVVTLPNTGNVATRQGRIKVEAVGNLFFDISDADLTLTSTNTPPVFSASGSGLTLVRGTPTDTAAIVGTVTPGSSALSSVSVSGAPDGVVVTGSIFNGSSVRLAGSAACRVTTTETSRTYPVSVVVTDATGSTASGAVNVVVEPNPAPTLGSYADATVTQTDTLTVSPSAGPADANFNLAANPFTVLPTALPGGGTISVDQTTGAVSVVPTAASTLGTTAVRVTFQDDCGAATVKIFNVTVVAPSNVPAITSTLTASGTVGSAFNYQITASHSPTSFGVSGLPAGLMFDAASGLLTGTPAQAGTFVVSLSASNANGIGMASLTLTLAAAPVIPVPSVDSAGFASAKIGTAFSYQITATNSPTSFAASGLPDGLSLNTATGLITGTPTQTGTFRIALSAANNGGMGGGTLIVTVAAKLPVVTLVATVPTVTIGSGDIGQFTVTLSEAQADTLLVYYTIKGSAANGTDYVLLNGHKKFKPGKTTKPIKIIPTGDLAGLVKKTVKLTLTANPAYTVGAVSTAKVKILAGQ